MAEEEIDIKQIQEEVDDIFEQYEYMIMKQYFITPFNPTFKPNVLRSDFNFGTYLKYCLMEFIAGMFNFSWTSIIFMLTMIMFWSATIDPYFKNVSFNFILNIIFLYLIHYK